MKDRKRYHEMGLICILMLISVFLRFYWTDFSKHLLVYYDELRYLSIAESIVDEGEILIYNNTSGYQKIFYSLFLAPAYLISDRVLSLKVIGLINSCLMSIGVIPVWLLAKKLLSSRLIRIATSILYLIGSDMTYSMTFMSESLYIPMALWMIYGLYCFFEYKNVHRKIICSAGVGICIYLMYLTKEVALVFLIAVPALRVTEYVYLRIYGDTKESLSWKQIFLETVGILVPFFLCHIIMKNTLFAGLGNSYDQMGLEVLFQEGRIRYLLYGFVYYLCSCLVAFGVLPVIMPIIKFHGLSYKEKRLYIFMALLILLTACVVAYTITVREDFGTAHELTPRVHLRYICYAMWPMLILFFKLYESSEKASFDAVIKTLIMVTVFGIVFVMFWRGAYNASGVDSANLTYLQDISENKLLIFNSILVLGTISTVLLFDRLKVIIYVVFLLCFCGVQVVNTALKINVYYNQYFMTEDEFEDVMEVKNFISQHSQENFIVVKDQLENCSRLLDTYVNYDNMYTISWTTLNNMQQTMNGEVPVDQLSCIYDGSVYDIQSGDYLILDRDSPLYVTDTACEIVLSNEHFTVYDMNDLTYLPYIRNQSVIAGGENIYTPETCWPFASNDPGKFISTSTETCALVYGPYITLPSGNYTFEIYYSYEGETISSDTIIGYCDIFSDSSSRNWAQYVTNFTPSERMVKIENVAFDTEIPRFELRMWTEMAGIRVEKIVINKLL